MGQAQGQKRAPKFKASKYEAPKPRRVTKEQISRATYKDVKAIRKIRLRQRKNKIKFDYWNYKTGTS